MYAFSKNEKTCGQQLERIRRTAIAVWKYGEFKFQVRESLAAIASGNKSRLPFYRMIDQPLNDTMVRLLKGVRIEVKESNGELRIFLPDSNISDRKHQLFVEWFMSTAAAYAYYSNVDDQYVIHLKIRRYVKPFSLYRVEGVYVDQDLVDAIKSVLGDGYNPDIRRQPEHVKIPPMENKPSLPVIDEGSRFVYLTGQIQQYQNMLEARQKEIIEIKNKIRELQSDLQIIRNADILDISEKYTPYLEKV